MSRRDVFDALIMIGIMAELVFLFCLTA